MNPTDRTAPNPTPLVSVIVPCRNEGKWIGACLQSILDNDYPGDCLEVLVVDGMSSDGTRQVIESFAARYPRLRLVNNEKQITPAAMNLGIAAASGSVIVRMDAHVEYPGNYISSLVEALGRERGRQRGRRLPDAAGQRFGHGPGRGPRHVASAGRGQFPLSHRRRREDRWVDTVPFGCYRREVFDRIGLFDEELVRNQDDELNLRLIKHGGRILLSPRIVCKYFARDSLAKLWRMYYQYGYFKPLVVRKVGGVMTLRQLAPPLFVLCLAANGAGGDC